MRVGRSLVAIALLFAAGAQAATWLPVPGAPDVEIDAAWLQQAPPVVEAWLRWRGRPALASAQLAELRVRVQRSVLRAEFDCSRRTVRVLAVHAYAGGGAPVFMSSVPGARQPVQGPELAWAYDAVCEAARSGARL